MQQVIVVYFSGSGHTEKVAWKIKEGVESTGAGCKLLNAEEAMERLEEFDDASGIIFGSPTYLGSVSAKMKEFMEATSSRWAKAQWKDKYAAGFSNSGSLSGDKLSTLMQFVIFACQHKMIWVSAGLPSVLKSEGHGGKPEDINRIGSYVGLMTQSDHADSANTPSSGDVSSAKLFGERFGKIVVSK